MDKNFAVINTDPEVAVISYWDGNAMTRREAVTRAATANGHEPIGNPYKAVRLVPIGEEGSTPVRITTDELGALARVNQFVTEHESWEGENSHIRTTGEYGTPERYSLNSGDLKALLAIVRQIPIES
jgi:hypothetical protein